MSAKNVENLYIDIDEVQVSPRGRKPNLDANLLALISGLPEGKAIRLDSIGEVPANDRPTVSAKIRKHWAAAFPGTKPRIDYTPNGVPQIRRK